jgi:hypothetical protein
MTTVWLGTARAAVYSGARGEGEIIERKTAQKMSPDPAALVGMWQWVGSKKPVIESSQVLEESLGIG